MSSENPFLISGYISSDYFCDREEETSRILSALQNRRNLTLVSIRRLGKTGLIKHVFHQLRNSKYRLIYIDIMATDSLQELVRALGNAIIADAQKHSKDYLKKIMRLVSGIKARLTFDHITGTPAIELGYADHRHIERDHIMDIIDFYDSYTFYIQSYFNRLFATGEKKISLELIEKIKITLPEEREYIFYNYKSLLTDIQYSVLKAIAQEEAVSQPTAKVFMQKHGFVQASSLSKSIKTLLDKEMIYQEDGKYKVYDLFFSKWLKYK